MNRVLLIALLILLAACSAKLSLAVPQGAPVRVVRSGTETLLQPSQPRYRQLQAWLAQNQSGWSQVYATNPNGGVLVSSGHLHLQFVDSAVFVLTNDGMFTKPVKASDYAFLGAEAGT